MMQKWELQPAYLIDSPATNLPQLHTHQLSPNNTSHYTPNPFNRTAPPSQPLDRSEPGEPNSIRPPPQTPSPPTMQVASIITDLTTLRACVSPTAALPPHTNGSWPRIRSPLMLPQDEPAARALVAARPDTTAQTPNQTPPAAGAKADEEQDPDIARARQLVALHRDVHRSGLGGESGGVDAGMMAAREAVGKALRQVGA
jgi:hypothetical protein